MKESDGLKQSKQFLVTSKDWLVTSLYHALASLILELSQANIEKNL
jgi:hypothetical protein